MAKINDGGPAFPVASFVHPDGDIEWGFSGMSLRDYFAGQAMVACMSSPVWVKGLDAKAAEAGVSLSDALANMSYQYADAMMRERAK